MENDRASKRRKLSPLEDGTTKALPGFAKWNIEQDYERRPRKNKKKEESKRLPIKSQESGRWEQDQSKKDASDEEGDGNIFSDSNAGEDEEDSAVADLQPTSTPKTPRLPPKEEIRRAKEELARIAGLLSESPEENIALLNSLAQFTGSDNPTVKKLALGTQYAVYKDIIPGYRIRPISKEDAGSKLSKDVKKLRTFEQSLLSGYREYVQTLSRLASPDKNADISVAAVAISCVSNLLNSIPHFNFRNDLIGVLVQRLSKRNINPEFIKAREALEQLFRDDEHGHASLEAVSQLTKMLKTKNYHVHESVLNTFLHLRLLSEFAHKASTSRIDKDDETPPNKMAKKIKTKKEFLTKRDRKLRRERKDVEKEMREADAAVSYEDRDKNQAETLKLVFIAYFRILKARTPHLTGAVLEGLAKYAHLINQDFFGDVLEALKDLVNDANASLQDTADDANGEEDDDDDNDIAPRNATRESLLSTITAFALLQGQQDVVKSANTLNLDLNFFTTNLYRTLLPLAMDADIERTSTTSTPPTSATALSPEIKTQTKINVATTSVLLLRSLHAILLPTNTPSKSVPPVRIAAFAKQLHTLSLHSPPKSAIALLTLLKEVVRVHGPKIAGLWDTEERRGDGVFDAEGGSVEGANPFAATIWEGEVLRLHFDPGVREGVKVVEEGVKGLIGPRER